jgi:hypothetical protein
MFLESAASELFLFSSIVRHKKEEQCKVRRENKSRVGRNAATFNHNKRRRLSK